MKERRPRPLLNLIVWFGTAAFLVFIVMKAGALIEETYHPAAEFRVQPYGSDGTTGRGGPGTYEMGPGRQL